MNLKHITMMNGMFLSLVLCFPFYLTAQSDSIIYFDISWNVTIKDSAVFYRLIDKKENLHHAKDYYISGQLQMEGDYSSLEPEIQEGYFTWYFESGQKFVEGNFVHGQREGIWTFWYPDGLKKQEIKFRPGSEEDYLIRWRSKREKNSIGLIEQAIKKKKNGKTAEAEALLNAAIANNPFSADAFYERGLLKCTMNRNDAGCDDLKKAKEYGFFDNETINEAVGKYCR